MNACYHTTKLKFLSDILKNGLQPIYGNNSYLTADSKTGIISYSVGIQGTVNTFSVFNRFYNYAIEGRINEESFRETLSSEEFAKHKKSIEDIKNTSSFQDWIKDNIYLCFDGNCISEKNEDRPEDSYTTQSIPAKQLKVCVIKNKKDNTISSYSMLDIYSFFYAQNPELKEGLCTYRFKENIDKFKSDEYWLDNIDLEQFCEMFPELIENENLEAQEQISTTDIRRRTVPKTNSDDKEKISNIFNKWMSREKGISKD